MRKVSILIVVGIVLGASLSLELHGVAGWREFRFKADPFERRASIAAVKASIRQYNKASAGIYATGGLRDELAVIPASALVKRRLFQDVNKLMADGAIMVFDRDKDEVERVTFNNRKFAIAEGREVWAVSLQQAASRKPIFNIKASDVRVRYHLRLEAGVWVVHAVEVFPPDEPIPPMNTEPAL